MDKLSAADFRNPAIVLWGPVDSDMYSNFRQQLKAAPADGLVVVELTTLGGDPEIARLMGEDIRYHSDMEPNRRFVFLGKAAIYSAGTTFLSFFCKENRYLTRGTRLMLHERQMHSEVKLEGPLTSCAAIVRAKLHEIEASIAIQNEGFEHLITGSQVTMEDVLKRAPNNWYIADQEAVALGLVEAVI